MTVPLRASIDTGLYLGMGIDRAAAFAEARQKRMSGIAAAVAPPWLTLATGSGADNPSP